MDIYSIANNIESYCPELSMYDMAIVGAGPAGSTTARYLARQGFNVCLIDRNEFPRDKPCGGGFSYSLINEFPWLKKKQELFLDAICRIAVLHSPNLKITLKSSVDMAVARRANFDNAIFTEACDSGADALLNSRVKDISINDKVSILLANGDQIDARVAVGADGANSLVARRLSLNKKWPYGSLIPCNVCEIPMNPEMIDEFYTPDREYHFFANCGGEPGYGWIFPKSETVNVGIGILGNRAKGLPRKFRNYIAMLQNLGLLPKKVDLSHARGAVVPIRGTIRKTYANRASLVGDSAGMVSPITGGGIHYAMRAARIAASVLSQLFENDCLDERSLALYQQIWWQDFGHKIKKQLPAQRIVTSDILDVLFEIGSRDSKIQEIVSNAFSESSERDIEILPLILRTISVCLKSSFGLYYR